MACPYFYPTSKFAARPWPDAPMLPLGDAHEGRCQADPAAGFHPSGARMKEYCNFGYARQYCDRFPLDSGPDAVRFSISRDRNGIVDMYYVLEKDHRPFEHGPLAYEVSRGAFQAPPANPILNRQAEAYVESYLRRKPVQST